MVVGLAAAHAPPEEMPSHLRQRYTMGGSIAVDHLYVDEHTDGSAHYTFANHDIEAMLATARKMLNGSIPRLRQSQRHPTEAIRELQPTLIGAAAIVFGSTEPWAECLLLAAGVNNVTTVDYNYLALDHPAMFTTTVAELAADARYDVAVAVSSFDHDGLGRYGDPLHPEGDLLAMRTAWRALRPGGLLILSLPVGPDLIVWNLHRRYGPIRLPRMLEGWELVSRFGWADELLHTQSDHRIRVEPVHVLRKNSSEVDLPVDPPPRLPQPDKEDKEEV